jgi:hypothetical protein
MAALGDDVTGGGERIRSGMLLKLQTDVAGFEAKCVPFFMRFAQFCIMQPGTDRKTLTLA